MSDCDSCASRGGCPSATDNGSCSTAEQVENINNSHELFEKLPPSEGSQIKHVLAVASGIEPAPVCTAVRCRVAAKKN